VETIRKEPGVVGRRIYDITWDLSPDVDISFYRIWGSETDGFSVNQSSEVFNGPASGARISVDRASSGSTNNLYWRIAAIDVWQDDFNPTAQQTIPGQS